MRCRTASHIAVASRDLGLTKSCLGHELSRLRCRPCGAPFASLRRSARSVAPNLNGISSLSLRVGPPNDGVFHFVSPSCCRFVPVRSSTEQSTFRGGDEGRKGAEKRGGRGPGSEKVGAKRKKGRGKTGQSLTQRTHFNRATH